MRWSWQNLIERPVERGLGHQEDGQPHDGNRRRPGYPSSQCTGRRLLLCSVPAAIAALAEPLRRARDLALETVLMGIRFRLSRIWRGTIVSFRCAPRTNTRIESGRVRSRATGSILVRRPSTTRWSRSTWSDPPHSTRGWAVQRDYLTGPLARYALELLHPSSRGTGSGNRSRLGPGSHQSLPEHRGPSRRTRLRMRRGPPNGGVVSAPAPTCRRDFTPGRGGLRCH